MNSAASAGDVSFEITMKRSSFKAMVSFLAAYNFSLPILSRLISANVQSNFPCYFCRLSLQASSANMETSSGILSAWDTAKQNHSGK